MSDKRKVIVNEESDLTKVLDLDDFAPEVDLANIKIDKVSFSMEDSSILEEDNLNTLEQEDDLSDSDDDEVENDGYTRVEDLDDSQEIWEDGPNAGMIKMWKKQYGDIYVTSLSFDKHIVWRSLNRGEYKQIVKKMEQLTQAGTLSSAEANMWNEETIAELCILFPQYDKRSLSGIMAGMPSLIAQEVLEASGFVALEVRQL